MGTALSAPSVFGVYWFIPFGAVGALLVIRRPGTSIGWVLFGLAWCFAIEATSVAATSEQFADGSVGLSTVLHAVAQSPSGSLGFLLFGLLAMVYPSGKLPVGRWGTAGRVALSLCLVLITMGLVMPTTRRQPCRDVRRRRAGEESAGGLAGARDLAGAGRLADPTPNTVIVPVVLLVIAGAISLIALRTRHASGVERQQIRWLGASIGLVVVAVLSGLILGILVPGALETGWAWVPVTLAFPSVPVAVGIAILRYRLYDIDRSSAGRSPTLVITGFLVATYPSSSRPPASSAS